MFQSIIQGIELTTGVRLIIHQQYNLPKTITLISDKYDYMSEYRLVEQFVRTIVE